MRLAIAILLVALAPVCHAQKFRFSPLTETVIQERAEQPPASRQDREARIKELFMQAGCTRDRLSEQPLDSLPGANLICRLPGKSKEVIIVGANSRQAVLDNWTSACLLPSLFQSLAGRKRRHTFLFIAFADGDRDLAGSQFFAAHMNQADADHTEAMINLDALGFSPTKISSSGSDKKLVESFINVMYALKQVASQVDIARAMRVDSEPFAAREIPQITFHSLTQDAVAGLQPQEQALVSTGNSDFAHVETGFRSGLYYNSYHLISGYLAYLDETLKPRKHGK
jgi:hypothetical protein